MFKRAVTIMTFLVGCSVALAQERGSSQEQQACSRDVSRHCRKVMDGADDAIRQCLVQHRNKLTSACRKILEGHGQ